MAGQLPSPSESEAKWRVAAQFLSGELLTEQRVCPGTSVAQLREAIAEAAGITGHLRLVHNGTPLAEELAVADAGLSDGATVVAVRIAGLTLATHSMAGDGSVSVRSFDGAGSKALRPLATLEWSTCAVLSIALSPDGTRVALSSVEPYPGDRFALVSLWRVESGLQECVWQVLGTTGVRCIAFSPDGQSLAAGVGDVGSVGDVDSGSDVDSVGDVDSGSVVIWGVDTLQKRAEFDCLMSWLYTVAYSPCGQRLVTGGYCMAKVWEVDAGRCLGAFAEHTDMVKCARYSPNGSLVATACEDSTAMLWSPIDFSRVATLAGHDDQICGVGFSPDGALLVTASSDSTARIWEVSSSRCVRTLDCPEEDVMFAAFSPDGALIFTGSDCAIRVWNAETGQMEAEYEGEVPMAIALEV